MKKIKFKKGSVLAFLVVLFSFVSQIDWNEFQEHFNSAKAIAQQVVKTNDLEYLSFQENKNTRKVEYVRKVDGDTAVFYLNDEEIKCRFLAVDTPETVKPNTEVQYYGSQASDYTELRLTQAKEIYLEYDDNSDNEDKYGRTLAWIWVDGTLLQEDLLRSGFAKTAYLYGNYKYNDYLISVERKAQKEKIGLWGNE